MGTPKARFELVVEVPGTHKEALHKLKGFLKVAFRWFGIKALSVKEGEKEVVTGVL
ncbi:MAG: hypothetical protein MN733_36870 [Nitrososphaera sp.]|nr:hypothetical protein [Nitrososphaera sp.]